MTDLWTKEFDRYSQLVTEQKVLWFSRFLFYVSMFARDTYEPGNDAVGKPKELRRFNELLHRASSQQLELVLKHKEGVPDDQFFEMVSSELNDLGVKNEGLIALLYSN